MTTVFIVNVYLDMTVNIFNLGQIASIWKRHPRIGEQLTEDNNKKLNMETKTIVFRLRQRNKLIKYVKITALKRSSFIPSLLL